MCVYMSVVYRVFVFHCLASGASIQCSLTSKSDYSTQNPPTRHLLKSEINIVDQKFYKKHVGKKWRTSSR